MNLSSTQKLSEITNIIVDDQIDYLKIKNALGKLKNLFEEVSGYDAHNLSNDDNIHLSSGKAIGPKWAGMCVDDIMRTKRFITGVYKAINKVQLEKENSPVEILYSGTGPFATLVMPLITLFKSTEIQFTLLEINPVSIEYLKNTVKGLKAQDYVRELHECDATRFELSSSNDIDIVIIECLQHALAREPQVAITHNLLPQIKKECILIPEDISLHVALIDSNKKNEYSQLSDGIRRLDFYENSNPVFSLNKETVLINEQMNFQEFKILFSKEQLRDKNVVAITTEITVFEDEKILINDSGLTIPKILGYLDHNPIKGVKTKYILGENPELQTTLLRD